jgi:hypothetical protein
MGGQRCGCQLSLTGVKLHEIKSLEAIWVQLKTIGRTMTQLKFSKSQIKNPQRRVV